MKKKIVTHYYGNNRNGQPEVFNSTQGNYCVIKRGSKWFFLNDDGKEQPTMADKDYRYFIRTGGWLEFPGNPFEAAKSRSKNVLLQSVWEIQELTASYHPHSPGLRVEIARILVKFAAHCANRDQENRAKGLRYSDAARLPLTGHPIGGLS